MAADEATSESLDARGIRAIDPTPAFDTLEALVGLGSATATAAAIDWSRWRRAHSDVGHSPFFAQLPGASVRPKRRPIDELEELPPDQHASWMNAYVARTAAEILRTSDLEPQRPLGEYGFDSMMMMSLRTRIEGDLGLPVSTAQLYAHGSVARVAAHLNAMLSAKGPTRAPTPAADIEGELSRELELLRRRGFES